MAKELNDSNFEELVLKNDKPVLVDFWAEWCHPCRSMGPMIEELSTEFQGKAEIGKLNVDYNSAITTRYQIRNLPTIIIFKNGTIVDKIVGIRNKKDFSDLLIKHSN